MAQHYPGVVIGETLNVYWVKLVFLGVVHRNAMFNCSVLHLLQGGGNKGIGKNNKQV